MKLSFPGNANQYSLEEERFNRLIGDNMRKTRMLKGLTAKQVAEKIGLTQASYSRYERGEVKNVSLFMVGKIVKALEINIGSIADLT